MAANKILVLTGFHPCWKKNDHITFLGPWCLERPHLGLPIDIPHAASFKICPFHWNNRRKLKKDYDYLEKLHKNLLASLAKCLNKFHKKSYSLRYWQILIDPWLMAYLGTMFDRWETIRLAMLNEDKFKIPVSKNNSQKKYYIFSYNEFISYIISDIGNENIFESILKYQYLNRIEIEKTITLKKQKTFCSPRSTLKNLLNDLLIKTEQKINLFFNKITRKNKIIFQDTYFKWYSIICLSLALRQFPKTRNYELQLEKKTLRSLLYQKKNRARNLSLQWNPANQFESFLFSRLQDDLPSCVIEKYNKLRHMACGLFLDPEIIITSGSHWGNPLAKVWMAEHVEKNGKLVILEHGGSFPARKELFNFEEDIADWKGTWFSPYHPKHIQVPPPKLIGMRHVFKNKILSAFKNKYCLIIGNENPKYVYRAMFYPMADQCLKSLISVNEMVGRLLPSIQEKVRIRPYPKNMGWNTKALFLEAHGNKKMCSSKTLWQAFKSARVIVCTNPETTFTEAMATCRPVILLYLDKINERHSVTFPLIKLMRDAKIVFHKSDQAADHINKIWNNPFAWWNSLKVVNARKVFNKRAGRVCENWLTEWKRLCLINQEES